MHIVEQLIAERAPKLMSRPALFKALRPLLYRMLAYDAAVFLADAIKDKTGHEAFKLVTKHISPRTAVQDLTHLPKTGRCILISNHPTGLADGMAVFQAIRERRPDHVFLANADALRVMPKARDLIIPVEWVKDKRSSAKTRPELRDITLFHELLNKKGQTFSLTFGEKIDPETLPKNADQASAMIRAFVEAL